MNYSCPKCSGQMELRTGQYGKFWGCIDYPKCGGTRSANPDGTLKTQPPPPGSRFTLKDIAGFLQEAVGLLYGYQKADWVEEGVEIEAVVEEHDGRPGVLLQFGGHMYWLPVLRLTARKDIPKI